MTLQLDTQEEAFQLARRGRSLLEDAALLMERAGVTEEERNKLWAAWRDLDMLASRFTGILQDVEGVTP